MIHESLCGALSSLYLQFHFGCCVGITDDPDWPGQDVSDGASMAASSWPHLSS